MAMTIKKLKQVPVRLARKIQQNAVTAGGGAWDRLLKSVDRAKEELQFQQDEECFWRGHADVT